VRYSITPCTSTSTETMGRSSPKCLSKMEKGLVFTPLFQLRFREVSYRICTLTTLEIPIQFTKNGVFY
jgi:hypothetical protein